MYTGTYDAGSLARRFACCCGADAQAFLDLSLFNAVPGMRNLMEDYTLADWDPDDNSGRLWL